MKQCEPGCIVNAVIDWVSWKSTTDEWGAVCLQGCWTVTDNPRLLCNLLVVVLSLHKFIWSSWKYTACKPNFRSQKRSMAVNLLGNIRLLTVETSWIRLRRPFGPILPKACWETYIERKCERIWLKSHHNHLCTVTTHWTWVVTGLIWNFSYLKVNSVNMILGKISVTDTDWFLSLRSYQFCRKFSKLCYCLNHYLYPAPSVWQCVGGNASTSNTSAVHLCSCPHWKQPWSHSESARKRRKREKDMF